MVLETIPNHWIPFIIFFARICDVSLGTVRIIFVSRGMKHRAALLGFLEILIWIIVVAQLIQHLDNWLNYIAFAGGFSVGIYLGVTLEKKLELGTIILRIITQRDAGELIENLRRSDFMITSVEAKGGEGPVEIVFMVLKSKRWKEAIGIVESFDPKAFFSVEDVKYASSDLRDSIELPAVRGAFNRLLRTRKGL